MKTVAAITGILAVCLTVGVISNPALIFAAGGFWALFIVLIPIAISNRPKLFSIWSFVILTVAIGLTARGIFISVNLPDPSEIDRLYLLGRNTNFFVKPLFVLLIGLAALAGGYVLFPEKTFQKANYQWAPKRVVVIGVAALVVSIASFLLYAFFTDGLSLDSLSAKRTPIPGIDLAGRDFKSYGILRHLSLLAIFAHLLMLALAFETRKRSHFVLAGLLLFAACLQPFYASVRTVVAANFIFSAAMVYFLGGKKVHVKLLGFFALIAILVTVMTTLRSGDSGKNVIESIVLNRNQIELPKTAHIINAVPEVLDFQYGKTLLRWFAAPIPREFWPDKPVIHPGPIIGDTIYGQRVGGVPPGLIGELWWNFGWLGIAVGSFTCGAGLKWLENRFLPFKNPDPIAVSVYIAGPMLIGYEAIGSSIGSGVFRMVSGLIIISVLLWIVKRR